MHLSKSINLMSIILWALPHLLDLNTSSPSPSSRGCHTKWINLYIYLSIYTECTKKITKLKKIATQWQYWIHGKKAHLIIHMHVVYVSVCVCLIILCVIEWENDVDREQRIERSALYQSILTNQFVNLFDVLSFESKLCHFPSSVRYSANSRHAYTFPNRLNYVA